MKIRRYVKHDTAGPGLLGVLSDPDSGRDKIVLGFVKGSFRFWNGLGVNTDDILDTDNTTDQDGFLVTMLDACGKALVVQSVHGLTSTRSRHSQAPRP